MVINKIKTASFCILLLIIVASKAGAVEPLSHMGVIPLTSEPLASQFAQRLAAQGSPLFFVSNVNQGVSQGDIIRFRDKAVLIDGDVWQTMKNMGVLKHLSNLPLVTLNARARSGVWDSRARKVSNSNEIKGYTLGRELLKVFEDYFGNTPSGMELVIRFSGSHMTFIAPRQLMNELTFANVVRLKKSGGKPAFITTKPPQRIFVQENFYWRIWAVDPAEPSGQLNYTIGSQLPPGLLWDPTEHAVSGNPQQAGSWPLTFTAKNSRGQSVSLNCTLAVIENTPPRIGVKIENPPISADLWEYRPVIGDAEHLFDELEVRLFEHPEGMQVDPQTKTITWEIPPTVRDTLISFYLAARDPLGAVGREKIELQIISKEQAENPVFVDLRLPLDTLIQGHVYRWPERILARTDWLRRDVQLKSVQGDNRTEFVGSDTLGEGILILQPMEHGVHKLDFTFGYDTATVSIQKECVVIPNRPPVFKSTLTSYTFEKEEHAVYTPVLTDEDNDSLHLSVINHDGHTHSIDNGMLVLPTHDPGLHTALLKATDPFGNSAQQHLYYFVEPERKHHNLFFFQKTHRKSFDLGFQSGSFRFGFYAPDIFKTLTTGFLGLNTDESPFIFFGANPLGEKQAALNNYLFFDCGINFRVYNDQLFGGGIMGRIQGDYRHNGTSPWRFMSLFSLRIKQGIFMVDTSGFQEQLQQYTNDWLSSGNSDYLEEIEPLVKLFEAYGQEDNFGVLLLLQTLYRLPFSFWLGPAVWVEDEIKKVKPQDYETLEDAQKDRGNFLVQYTGFSILHDWHWRKINLSQQLRLGWRGDSFTPQLKWNAAIRFKPNRYN